MSSALPLAWITGASQGIGRSLAVELLQRGWRVAATARSESPLLRLQQAHPGQLFSFPADVCDPAQMARTIDAIEDQQGPIQLAIFNAGSHQPEHASQFQARTVRQLIELNLLGVCNGLEPLLPRMLERGQGQIAAVASLAGYRGLPTAAAYGASKAALINLMESIALDLRGSGVKIQVINPGFVKTPLTDRNSFAMPGLISSDQAARSIAEGLMGNRFEIRFPAGFATLMAVLRHLPYRLYFPLVARLTRGDS
ncbi:SDR family NAD(P)-dependent oxidoreductase [Motiliproteus sediminis]|uniref:SDR family NAD(P)-dependent oxidoreductase n=1 Tax=Motiliproteus sediminis TaxID=1468178 RepID=UPI001AEF592B|nr:SDR family NAD(P)-dependent oxidoreductase [Motiliproteus sediminis]